MLITAGGSVGLRVLGSGGRTAIGSYDQIAHVLKDRLSPEHAALLAQPSEHGGQIDWYTAFPAEQKPLNLKDLGTKERERLVARLERLVGDITSLAKGLQDSPSEADRALGEMLVFALEVPGDDMIWLVGDQPVLTFWGHVKSHAQPVEGPVKALLSKAALSPAPSRPAEVEDPTKAASRRAARIVEPDPLPSTGSAVIWRAFSWPAPLLWSVLAALLLFNGWQLLRSCSLHLPFLPAGWLNYCPAQTDGGVLAAIAREREQQQLLQGEYDQLVRDTDLKRQACFLTRRPEPPPVRPPPVTQAPIEAPPKREEAMLIPRDTRRLDFLEGCWRSDAGIVEEQTKKPITISYCFGKDGRGTRQIKYDTSNVTCGGPLTGRRDGGNLVIDIGVAPCSDGSRFAAARDQCRSGENAEARCDEYSEGRLDPRFSNHRFLKPKE